MDRKILIDAAVVKTMKAAKKTTYRDIQMSVIGLVRFPLEISDLNKRIEGLINNGYMELVDPNAEKFNPTTVYSYIA